MPMLVIPTHTVGIWLVPPPTGGEVSDPNEAASKAWRMRIIHTNSNKSVGRIAVLEDGEDSKRAEKELSDNWERYCTTDWDAAETVPNRKLDTSAVSKLG